MGNINIKLLATELKLSVSTISKALMDSHEISSETKQRVLDLAKKLNYIPNPYARSLRGRKSKTIAVVVPEVADSFFSLAINGIEKVAQEKGYHVLIYLTHESFNKEEAILKDFQSGRVDGILISVSRETKQSQHISNASSKGIPVVFFDRTCDDIEAATITTNDFESGYMAAKHLVENGCKQIAYLSISNSLSIINKRMEGYKQALSDYRLKYKDENILLCTNDIEKDSNLISNLMKRKERPDGIIASVEKFTTPLYLVCKELNLSIPGDVKIVSFSNLSTAVILNPSLTTITQPAFEIGKTAASVLFRALEKKTYNPRHEKIVLPSKLIVRTSTQSDLPV
jgi:LacI family transcriptional regulator